MDCTNSTVNFYLHFAVNDNCWFDISVMTTWCCQWRALKPSTHTNVHGQCAQLTFLRLEHGLWTRAPVQTTCVHGPCWCLFWTPVFTIDVFDTHEHGPGSVYWALVLVFSTIVCIDTWHWNRNHQLGDIWSFDRWLFIDDHLVLSHNPHGLLFLNKLYFTLMEKTS